MRGVWRVIGVVVAGGVALSACGGASTAKAASTPTITPSISVPPFTPLSNPTPAQLKQEYLTLSTALEGRLNPLITTLSNTSNPTGAGEQVLPVASAYRSEMEAYAHDVSALTLPSAASVHVAEAIKEAKLTDHFLSILTQQDADTVVAWDGATYKVAVKTRNADSNIRMVLGLPPLQGAF